MFGKEAKPVIPIRWNNSASQGFFFPRRENTLPRQTIRTNLQKSGVRDLGYFFYKYNWIHTHTYTIHATYMGGQRQRENPEFFSIRKYLDLCIPTEN